MSYTRTYQTTQQTVGSSKTSDDSIIFSISTNNIGELRKYVTKENVNRIIDSKNRYTALHYAIQMRNEEMVRYLLSLDAEPSIKNGEGMDAFDMSIRFQLRTVIDSELNLKNNFIKSQQHIIKTTGDKLSIVEKHVEFLESSINKNKTEVNILKSENTTLKGQVSDLKVQLANSTKDATQYKLKYDGIVSQHTTEKRKFDSIKAEYDALDRSHTELKKRWKEQDTIIDNLLESNKKKK
jgi:hypothetical protein